MTDPSRDDAAAARTADLGYARVDVDRAARTGDPEVVFGAGKTPEQVVGILRTLHERHPERAVLATRLSADCDRASCAPRSRTRSSTRSPAPSRSAPCRRAGDWWP